MNWKNYLKADTPKIILTIIIFVIFVPFINYDIWIDCIDECSDLSSILLFITLVIMNNRTNFSSFDGISFPILIIGLIIAYSLGNLLGNFKIFNKYKK